MKCLRLAQQLAFGGASAPILTLLITIATSSVHAAAGLQNLGDPTRPPAGMFRPLPGGAHVQAATNAAPPPAAASAASAVSAAPAPAPRVMRLQAIRHNGASGGGIAMIDGELIALGGYVSGGWTLSAMNSDEVWLTGSAGQRRLTLLGGDTSTGKPRAVTGRRTRKE